MSKNINTAEYWDEVYSHEKTVDNVWRKYPVTHQMVKSALFDLEENTLIADLGCGTGELLCFLEDDIETKNILKIGFDISKEAIKQAQNNNIKTICFQNENVIDMLNIMIDNEQEFKGTYIATEFLEHFNFPENILSRTSKISKKAVFCVPNDILGNDVCKEHYQKFTVETFKVLLKKYYSNVRIVSYIDMWTHNGKSFEVKILMGVCYNE